MGYRDRGTATPSTAPRLPERRDGYAQGRPHVCAHPLMGRSDAYLRGQAAPLRFPTMAVAPAVDLPLQERPTHVRPRHGRGQRPRSLPKVLRRHARHLGIKPGNPDKQRCFWRSPRACSASPSRSSGRPCTHASSGTPSALRLPLPSWPTPGVPANAITAAWPARRAGLARRGAGPLVPGVSARPRRQQALRPAPSAQGIVAITFYSDCYSSIHGATGTFIGDRPIRHPQHWLRTAQRPWAPPCWPWPKLDDGQARLVDRPAWMPRARQLRRFA